MDKAEYINNFFDQELILLHREEDYHQIFTSRTCCNCLDSPNIIDLKCGHAICDKCIKEIAECPKCHKSIDQIEMLETRYESLSRIQNEMKQDLIPIIQSEIDKINNRVEGLNHKRILLENKVKRLKKDQSNNNSLIEMEESREGFILNCCNYHISDEERKLMNIYRCPNCFSIFGCELIPGYIFYKGWDRFGGDYNEGNSIDHLENINIDEINYYINVMQESDNSILGFNSLGWIKILDNVKIIIEEATHIYRGHPLGGLFIKKQFNHFISEKKIDNISNI